MAQIYRLIRFIVFFLSFEIKYVIVELLSLKTYISAHK